MFIRSERLFLRPVWAEERAGLQALVDDPAEAPELFAALGLEVGGAATGLFATDPRCPQFAITLPTAPDAPIIGAIGLMPGAPVELQSWVAPACRGQGFGGEAADMVLSLARTLGHGRVATRIGRDDLTAGCAGECSCPNRGGTTLSPSRPADFVPDPRDLAKRRMAA